MFPKQNCLPIPGIRPQARGRRKPLHPNHFLASVPLRNHHRPGRAQLRGNLLYLEEFLEFLGSLGMGWPETVSKPPGPDNQLARQCLWRVQVFGIISCRRTGELDSDRLEGSLGSRHSRLAGDRQAEPAETGAVIVLRRLLQTPLRWRWRDEADLLSVTLESPAIGQVAGCGGSIRAQARALHNCQNFLDLAKFKLQDGWRGGTNQPAPESQW